MMSETKTIVTVIVLMILSVLAVGAKQLIDEKDAVNAEHSTETRAEIYIPVPNNSYSSGYYVCGKYMETYITSPHFECFGSLYSCDGMPVVKCADGTAYFNPTDMKLDGVQLLDHNQIVPQR